MTIQHNQSGAGRRRESEALGRRAHDAYRRLQAETGRLRDSQNQLRGKNKQLADEIAERQETQRTLECTLAQLEVVAGELRDAKERLETQHQDLDDFVHALRRGDIDTITGEGGDGRILRLLDQNIVDENERLLQELARSNQELAQFASVISHDLKGPLRHVCQSLQLLEMKNKEKLDESSKEFLHLAVDGGKRMTAMIDGILEYARLTKGQTDFDVVEAEALLQSAWQNLTAAIEESGATIDQGTLPTITCHGMRITQLFQNLIGNAIKYRGEQTPQITVRAERHGSNWLFCVKDNGLGMEPEETQDIFKMFQRLHAQGTYEGLGIGLAYCKKIVESHGGQIWVDTAPGEGSTFFFTLPVHPDVGSHSQP